MAQQQSGKPWSGNNPIPNIKQFVENLDKNKKERDSQIDAEQKSSKVNNHTNNEIQSHQNAPRTKGGKTVLDPTTGKQVVIEDVGKEHMKAVEDPQLSVPNANLGKDTVGTRVLVVVHI